MTRFLILSALISVAAGAQPTTCSVNGGVPPTIRSEGLTEQIADVVLTCTGGTPTPAGAPVPQSDITVYLNANVSSRILSNVNGTAWLDALILIDEPHSTYNPNVPLLACGDPSAPDSLITPGVCSIIGTGTGVGVYNGGTNRPNVWQGQRVGISSITWLGVPIDGVPSGSSRIIRIKNIRVAAPTAMLPAPTPYRVVNMAISVGGSHPIAVDAGNTGQPAINNLAASLVAFLGSGMSVDVPIAPLFPLDGSHNADLLINGGPYRSTVADVVVNVQETGPSSAFKPKNWGYTATTSVEQNQNIPNLTYDTESGFENIGPAADPSPNPPLQLVDAGTFVAATAAFPSFHGLIGAGVADAGTHIVLNLGVPNGASLFVPTKIPLTQNDPPGLFSAQNGRITGYAYLVATDGAGVGSNRVPSLPGGAITACSAAITNAGVRCPVTTGLAKVSFDGIYQTAVYEVAESATFHFEQLSVPVVVAYTSGPSLVAGQTNLNAGLGPFSLASFSANSSEPMPRFTFARSGPTLYTITKQTPSYSGSLDTVNCQKIIGWAADRNRLNQSISVRIYDGATVLADIRALEPRSGVGTLLGDNGLHGFTFTVPPSLHDGRAHNIHVVYETDSTADIGGSPKMLTGCGPAYVGYVDSASCNGISGWIADTDRLAVPLVLALWDGATQIASITANRLRADVGAVLGDPGNHGFQFPVPNGYANGASHSLQIRYEASSTQVPGSPVTLTCGSVPRYAGYVDSASCSGISGWAADRVRPNVPLTVTLWDGSTQIGSTTANGSRGDVGALLVDNGLHGFTLAIPIGTASLISQTLQVRYETSATQVPGSPVTLNCGGVNYAGYVESSSCAGISGWAADRSRLNVPLTVTLWDGATQIGSTTASGSRGDVGAFLGDGGLHGFSIPLPSGTANGVSHALQVRYETSTSQVPGSPVALTCGGSSYTGWFDRAGCDALSGWAADKGKLNQPISVDILDGATLLTTVVANGSRGDVGGVLGDNGLHGFSVATPAALMDGKAHSMQVRYSGSTQFVENSPQALTCSTGASAFTGWVDTVGCSSISGWAANKNALNASISVEIYDGSTLLGTSAASASRSDVGAVLGDNGLHGFSFVTPAAVRDGKAHTITVRPAGSAVVLAGAKGLTCP